MLSRIEYIWGDGAQPTQELRSKTRIVELPDHRGVRLADFPDWGYDGSSTYQADGGDSDLTLRPVAFVDDPVRGAGNYLVLCEVLDGEGRPHATNTRAKLRDVLDAGAADAEAWVGFEQEYTLFRSERPLGFPDNGFPAPQGPFYCGVGADRIFGRDFVEAHTEACLAAGIMIYGINAEVMPGQWEFQIGTAGPLEVADHTVLARYLLYRVGEQFETVITLHPKPVRGDWNGAGAHTNFSTRSMRADDGMAAIDDAVRQLEARHADHVAVYGDGLAERLTGLHETCSIDEFRSGVADRGSSIRIPRHVAEAGSGYLEDRRPGANCDPYAVCARILRTVCGIGDRLKVAA